MTLSNPAQYISGRTVQEQMNSLIDYVDQRAADVALDAIASDVAQVHQDMLDADADATAAAASAAAAAGTLANAVKKTGEASQSIQGDVAVTGALSAGATNLYGNTSVTGDLSASGDLSVSGDAVLSGDTSVTTEATGTYSSRAANGLKVKNELDNYAPMLRTTGNQNYSGVKTNVHGAATTSSGANTPIIDKVNNVDLSQATTSNRYEFLPMIVDANDNIVGGIRVQVTSTNHIVFTLFTTKMDGTRANKQLADYDRTNDSWS